MSLFEEKIKQAIKEGVLDDLPGKGKPLQFEESAIHNEYWLVNKVLKNANYLPTWLELDKCIREAKERAPSLLEAHRTWLMEQRDRLFAAPTHEQSSIIERIRHVHERKQQEYAELIRGINPMIRKMNLETPVPHFQKNVIDEEEWLQRFSTCEEIYAQVIWEWSTQQAAGVEKGKGWFGRWKQRWRIRR